MPEAEWIYYKSIESSGACKNRFEGVADLYTGLHFVSVNAGSIKRGVARVKQEVAVADGGVGSDTTMAAQQLKISHSNRLCRAMNPLSPRLCRVCCEFGLTIRNKSRQSKMGLIAAVHMPIWDNLVPSSTSTTPRASHGASHHPHAGRARSGARPLRQSGAFHLGYRLLPGRDRCFSPSRKPRQA